MCQERDITERKSDGGLRMREGRVRKREIEKEGEIRGEKERERGEKKRNK